MAYIQERIGKDGKSRYRVQVRKRGHPTQTMTFGRKTDAKRWAQSIEAAMDERRFMNFSKAKRLTVRELIEQYQNDNLPLKPSQHHCRGSNLTGGKNRSELSSLLISRRTS